MPAPGQLFFVRSLTTRLQGGKPASAATTDVVTLDRRVWSSPTAQGRLYETAITSQPLTGGRVTRMGNPDAPQATAARAMVSRPIVHAVASRSRSSLGISPAARPPGSSITGPPVILITGPSLAAGHGWSRPRVSIFIEADCPGRITSN